MALSKEEILDAIAEMSVMDVVELVSAMEEKFGVSAAAAVAVAAAWDVIGNDDGGLDSLRMVFRRPLLDDGDVGDPVDDVGDPEVFGDDFTSSQFSP